MDRFAYMQSLQPQPTPEKKAYSLDFTQDEIILLYNVLGAYQNAIQTSTNCVLQTQLP